MQKVLIDIKDERYGRWVVLERADTKSYGDAMWLCRCDCGTERVVMGNSLRRGTSKSCGCLSAEIARSRMTGAKNYLKHGHSGTKIYAIWSAMKQRCYNPDNDSYLRYGARGITVCDAWRESFETFYADVGDAPEGLTLDRIDNDGNYEPGNIRWATRQQQADNKSGYHCACCRMGRIFRSEPAGKES